MPAPAVRVSVVGTRRADLVLPGAVPVAELLPVLAGEALEPEERYAGCRLLLADGRVLSAEEGVVAQGVRDGAVLSLVAGLEPPPPLGYDDAAEAMAEAVADVAAWSPGSGTALAAAGLCGLVATVAWASVLASGRVGTVLAVVLVVAALLPVVGPVLALASTPAGSHRWSDRVDAPRLAADAALARRRALVLLAMSGALVVTLAPVVAHGRWGAPLAVAACVATGLRTRRQHAAEEVLVGLVAAGLGLLATSVAVVVIDPGFRTPLALTALGVSLSLAAMRRRPGAAALWWGRLADATEGLAVLALLPLLALGAGLVPGVPS